MANIIKNTSECKVKFADSNGNHLSLSVPNPKTDLTDTEYFNAACRMIASNALRPFGEAVSTLTELKLVDIKRTYYDIDALNDN